MTQVRRLICAGAITVAAAAAGAGGASAATFYVGQRAGEDTNPCTTPGFPCATINGAIKKAEAAPPPNTIQVAAEVNEGFYFETLKLENPKAAGLTINGEQAGVVVRGNKAPAVIAKLAGAVTFSHLRLEASLFPAPGGKSAVADRGADLTFNDVAVANGAIEGTDGIEAKEGGSVTMNGGSVEMETANPLYGWAVEGVGVPLVLDGVKIVNGVTSVDQSGGIQSMESSLSVTDTQVSVKGSEFGVGISVSKDSSATIQNSRVKQSGSGGGVGFGETPVTVDGLQVEMVNPASMEYAVTANEAGAGSSTYSHLEVGGRWIGPGVSIFGHDTTLSDSHVTANGSASQPALLYVGESAGKGLLVQRSVLKSGPNANPSAVWDVNGNATVDSSQLLGGKVGITVEESSGSARTVTLSASTIDAGAPGTAADAAGVLGVAAISGKGPGSGTNVAIQGSIVLESQTAAASSGNQAAISCTHSAVPSQIQTGSGGSGAIECASGTSGNTGVSPLTSLFAEPLSEYKLSPSSGALDSVPSGTLSLPFGISPSSTDIAGGPRILDGNGDCVAVQDKGALELQGHSAPCPPSPLGTPKPTPNTTPIAGVISALTISPRAFAAAPSGATVSRVTKKRYGAKVGYRDSRQATTTFTVLRPSSGRRQGTSCKKRSHSNRHGKRCTILTALGGFTHADRAGTNSLHFSGRIRRHKLARGPYLLRAVARNAAGSGRPVTKTFYIK